MNSLPPKLRGIAEAAQEFIIDYTLFVNPLPNTHATLALMDKAWSKAQAELQLYSTRSRLVEKWVRVRLGHELPAS